uniref:DVU3141 family protein n=1 Tax=Neoroseomonas rubea TaxID=2748666 RepID=UPI0018E021E5
MRRGGLALALGAALLAGCGGNGAAPSAGAAVGAVVPIDDPVVAFAANAASGAEDTVRLAGTGQAARVRLVRAYAAASGRECREVMVAAGGGVQSRLLCRAGEGWREARPLLRDGTSRP